jgi:MFS family permease
MFASGAVIGLSVGGTIIQHFGWQATFLTIIPIAISLLIVIWRFINVNQNDLRQQQQSFHLQQHVSTSNPNLYERAAANNVSRNSNNKPVDVKGALALAATITSFLLLLTFLETGNNVSSTQLIIGLLAMAVISLSFFIIVEKRSTSPLIDFKIMLDKNLLISNILIMIIGLSMFMVFQTIPVLIRSPVPFGFGDTASKVGNVQLPFALVLLVIGPSSGFIISKLGSLKPIIIGTIISSAGFIGILLLHQTEIGISANLAILSAGLSLTSVGAMNVIILSTPRQSSGMSLGISSLMRIVGASIGPALAGMYMQSDQVMLTIGGMARFFPSIESYNLIFLTAAIVSILSIVMALLLRRRVQKMAIPNIF